MNILMWSLIGGPLVLALLSVGVGHRLSKIISPLLSLIPLIAAGQLFWSRQSSFDALSLAFVFLTALTILAFLLTAQTCRDYSKFAALGFFAQAGLNLVFLSHSVFWFYVGWEVALIPSILMIFGWGNDGRFQAGMKFLLFTIAGSLAMLGSILFLYVKSGSLEWANIAGASLSPNAQLAVFVGFFLAFAIKIPIFLFHSWQADTYSEASVPTALLLSAIFSKMGIYGLFRLVSLISPGIIPQVAPVIVGLCIVGAIYAALLAFSQSNLKRVIAYSSMSHLNLVAAAIFAAPHLAKAGAFFLAVSHVGLAIGFWWVIGVLKSRFGHVRLHELPGGIISENRVFTSVFFLLIMAGMAVPLTSGFPGEFVIIQGLLRFDFLTGMLACAPIIMGAVYMFRAYHTVMLGGNSPAVGTPIQLTKMEYGIAAFLILFILGLGIYPQIVFTLFGAV